MYRFYTPENFENVRKPKVFWSFQGVTEMEYWPKIG